MKPALPRWHRWGEPIAVALNLAYTIGYQQGVIWSFYIAAVGSGLFMLICWQQKLKLEAGLWLYYIAMAVYGIFSVQTAWPNP